MRSVGREVDMRWMRGGHEVDARWTRGGCKVDIRREGQIFKYVTYFNLKASFLPVMTNSFNHAKVWSPKLQ